MGLQGITHCIFQALHRSASNYLQYVLILGKNKGTLKPKTNETELKIQHDLDMPHRQSHTQCRDFPVAEGGMAGILDSNVGKCNPGML